MVQQMLMVALSLSGNNLFTLVPSHSCIIIEHISDLLYQSLQSSSFDET